MSQQLVRHDTLLQEVRIINTKTDKMKFSAECDLLMVYNYIIDHDVAGYVSLVYNNRLLIRRACYQQLQKHPDSKIKAKLLFIVICKVDRSACKYCSIPQGMR